MLKSNKKKLIDLLSEYFWRNGYIMVGRKYGKYLPEPPKIGFYDIDVLGRNKKEYIIGLSLNDDDLTNKDILEKIRYLSTRNSRYSKRSVKLLIGVSYLEYKHCKELLDSLEGINKKNLKLIALNEFANVDLFTSINRQNRNLSYSFVN